jgi:hypothetical protein
VDFQRALSSGRRAATAADALKKNNVAFIAKGCQQHGRVGPTWQFSAEPAGGLFRSDIEELIGLAAEAALVDNSAILNDSEIRLTKD